jgi:hypothetical protein
MRTRSILFCFFTWWALCVVFASAQSIAVDSATDDQLDQLIDRITKIPAADLDPGLPRIAFDEWLQEQAGEGAKISWTLHYANEPFEGEDTYLPPSIAADVNTKDGRSIAILIAVGAKRKIGNIRPIVYRIEEGRFAGSTLAGEDKPPFWVSLQRLRDLPLALCMEEEAKVLEVDE